MTITPWRALFWEPVAGTGERLMVGVIYYFDKKWTTARIIRDDILDCLYGKTSANVRKLLEHSFEIYAVAASASNDINAINFSASGITPGPARSTQVSSANELLHVAALLYSSLAQIDLFDEQEESDTPQAEEVNKRFATEVRELALSMRPDLAIGFGRGGVLVPGGKPVRFGYFTPSLIVHFSVLHPVRQAASVRDARAKLWEILKASQQSAISNTALITSIPRSDDPALGERQKREIESNRNEIEREANNAHISLYPVFNAEEGADRLIELTAA